MTIMPVILTNFIGIFFALYSLKSIINQFFEWRIKMKVSYLKIIVIILLSCPLFPKISLGTTCTLNAYDSIQTEIDSGCTLLILNSGTYDEPFTISNQTIKIKSATQAKADVLLKSRNPNTRMITITGNSTVTLESITIEGTGGGNGGYYFKRGIKKGSNIMTGVGKQKVEIEEGGCIYQEKGISTGSTTQHSYLFILNSTLQNCYATDEGGAVYSQDIFYNYNVEYISNETYSYGGAICHTSINQNGTYTSLYLYGSSFNENTAHYSGGAIHLYSDSEDGSESVIIDIQNSEFNSNNTIEWGGAISSVSTYLNISGTSFVANQSEVAGGILLFSSKINITKSKFYYNFAVYEGGAINVIDYTDVNVNESDFYMNTAYLSVGGAISTSYYGKEINISKSHFQLNFAENGGGAIRLYGIYNFLVEKSSFFENVASRIGGAIFKSSGSLNIENSTLSYNLASTGGGIGFDGVSTGNTLKNVTLFENIASTDGEAIYMFSSAVSVQSFNSVIYSDPSNLVNECNSKFINSMTTNNMNGDRSCGFAIINNPDLYLKESGMPTIAYPKIGSPIIDAGDLSYCPSDDQIDTSRPRDGDGDGNKECDMGAIEAKYFLANQYVNIDEITLFNDSEESKFKSIPLEKMKRLGDTPSMIREFFMDFYDQTLLDANLLVSKENYKQLISRIEYKELESRKAYKLNDLSRELGTDI